MSATVRRRFDVWALVRVVFLTLLTAFTLVPMIWMLLTSVKTQFAALQFPPQWWPHSPNLEQYRRLLSPASDTGRVFLRYMFNSLLVSTTTTILGVLVAVPAAYAFSRFRFPGRNLLFYGVLLRNMFPAVVFLMPLFIVMRWLHLVNTELSLILTYLTFGLPLSIWLLKGFYDNIPPQLEQAARLDGASRFQAFVRVVMPLSSPGIIATRSTPSSRRGTNTCMPLLS
jgi:multiple sugar transport system permease protein